MCSLVLPTLFSFCFKKNQTTQPGQSCTAWLQHHKKPPHHMQPSNKTAKWTNTGNKTQNPAINSLSSTTILVAQCQIGFVSWILAGCPHEFGPLDPSTSLSVQTFTMLSSNWKTRSVNLSGNILHIYVSMLFCDILGYCDAVPGLLFTIYLKGAIQTTQPFYTSNTFVQKTRLAESPLHKVSWSKPQKMQSRMSIPAHQCLGPL